MTALLLVALGSAGGAAARYVVDQLIQLRHERILPWGTMTINVTGAFLLGALVSTAGPLGLDDRVVLALGTGLLGAYTTFSTFTWETIRLVEDGALLAAALMVVMSLGVGLAAATAGLALGMLW